jgi:hypothetical protein
MTNTGKTVAMSYHTKQSRFLMRPKITYRNTGTAYKSYTKFIGIQITENLKWTTHVRILRLQLSKVCCIIKSVQGIMGLGMTTSFYHSKSELLVRYGIIFWRADNENIPIFTNDYDTHLRNTGTMNIFCDGIRLVCYWITSPHQWTTVAYANVDVLPEFSAD